MSRINDYYLAQQEKNPELAAMQAEMSEMQEPWWVTQDQDKEWQKHCEKMKDDKFINEIEECPF